MEYNIIIFKKFCYIYQLICRTTVYNKLTCYISFLGSETYNKEFINIFNFIIVLSIFSLFFNIFYAIFIFKKIQLEYI